MAGSLQLYTECKKAGIKPFPGTEFYLVQDRSDGKAKRYHTCMLAYTEAGYRNLIKFNTQSHRQFHFKPLLDLADLAAAYEAGLTEGLAITTGCYFGLPAQTYVHGGYDAAKQVVASYATWFPGATYVELQNHHIVDNEVPDQEIAEVMSRIASDLGLPCILTQDSHYTHPEHRPLHNTLKRLVTWGTDTDDAVFPGDGFHMVDDIWMRQHHPDNYGRGIEGLEDLLAKHTLTIPELDTYHYRMPELSADPKKELRRRVIDELQARGLDKPRYMERLFSELEIVEFTRTSGYLLLVARVTDYCQEKGIFYQARGSASGSLLCYLLGITSVDPLKWKLMMERFLSKDRTKPPDIDLDVEHDRRAEVMAMLESTFSTAQICTWGTYSLSGSDGENKGSLRVKAIARKRKSGEDPEWANFSTAEIAELQTLSSLNLVSGYGVHPAGVLVTSSRTELESLVPLMYVASSKTIVSQYDMKEVERIGLVKLDVLGLKTLTVLGLAINWLGWDKSTWTEQIPLTDRKTYATITKGHTAGVFQLEGYTATNGVTDLKPNKIADVIAAMALFRPATMNSGATSSYLKRRRRDEKPPVRHQILMTHTGPTYGILLYQEQVIGVLRDLGMQSDELTDFLKAVKASNEHIGDAKVKILSMMEQIKGLCDAVGMSTADYDWLAEALVAYANYGFNQSHATVYGLTAYRCAWLATHHPAAFFAALMSVYREDDKVASYRRQAQKLGVELLAPDVNRSGVGYRVEGTKAVRRGLEGIKHVGEKAAESIVANQPFTDFADFVNRVDARAVTGVKMYRQTRKTIPAVVPQTLEELKASEPVGKIQVLLEAQALRSLFKE